MVDESEDLSGRLARWSLKLQAFDFVIEYRKVVDLDSKEFLSDEYVKLKTDVHNDQKNMPDLKIEGNHINKRAFVKQH